MNRLCMTIKNTSTAQGRLNGIRAQDSLACASCLYCFTEPRTRPSTTRRSGLVLIIVLVTVVIMALSAYTFTALMQTEEQASRLITRQLQSKYLVDSGVDYTRGYLARDEASIREKGGLWDNSDQFQGIPVAAGVNDPANVGSFTVISSNLDDEANPEGFRYGLVDESSKLNLNVLPFWDESLGRQNPGISVRTDVLGALPEMTDEIADAILDWLDSNDDSREFGAESSYYRSQSPPYEAKNGPLDSLDELLLVRGVTPELLFGLDTNRNGILDDSEAAADNVSSVDANMKLGWANYITLYSNESNLNEDRLPRININDDDLEQLHDDLRSRFDDNWANFIVHWRSTPDDPSVNSSEAPFRLANQIPVDFDSATSQRKFNNVMDLVGALTRGTDSEGNDVLLRSPLPDPTDTTNPDLAVFGLALTAAMNELTHFDGASIPGRINIMQAPRIVLNAIPFLSEEQIDLIIDRREYEFDETDTTDLLRGHPTWIWAEGAPLIGIVDETTMNLVLPYICTGGEVFRAEIIGFFPDGIGTSRAEAVIDTIATQPRLLFWRDKSHLPSGYSVDVLGRSLAR